MPRRSASESVRKETALEALHLAMRATGRKQRPRPGKPGFEAVDQVMQWWRADWAERTPAQREADLRTASSWAKLRQRRAPHADVDVGRLPALVETLVATLRETPSRRSRQKLRDPALERALAAEGAAPVALAAAGFLGLAGCVPPRPGGKRARSPTGESAPDAASHPPAMRAHLGAMPAVLMALEASHARRALPISQGAAAAPAGGAERAWHGGLLGDVPLAPGGRMRPAFSLPFAPPEYAHAAVPPAYLSAPPVAVAVAATAIPLDHHIGQPSIWSQPAYQAPVPAYRQAVPPQMHFMPVPPAQVQQQ